MQIRKASAEEMLKLWGYEDGEDPSPTARYFCENISSGNADFWTIEESGELIGELYVFYLIEEDMIFANGTDTAYLCAFRVRKDHRGKGLGTALMDTVLSDLKESGISYATIGVGAEEERNIRLYRRLGFTGNIGECSFDPCARDEEKRPAEDAFILLRKEL